MRLRPLDERGLTLTEVTIVAAIGLLVLLGLGGFYLSSQATWLDASSQSITQREGTLIAHAVADRARTSRAAIVTPAPDADHAQVAFYSPTSGTTAEWCYWWNPADSLVHHGPDPVNDDRGALGASKVERFRVEADAAMVRVWVRLRSATGQQVEVATRALMRNR